MLQKEIEEKRRVPGTGTRLGVELHPPAAAQGTASLLAMISKPGAPWTTSSAWLIQTFVTGATPCRSGLSRRWLRRAGPYSREPERWTVPP